MCEVSSYMPTAHIKKTGHGGAHWITSVGVAETEGSLGLSPNLLWIEDFGPLQDPISINNDGDGPLISTCAYTCMDVHKQWWWCPRLSSDFHMCLHMHGCAQMTPSNSKVVRTDEIMSGAYCAIPCSQGLCSPILACSTHEEGKQQPRLGPFLWKPTRSWGQGWREVVLTAVSGAVRTLCFFPARRFVPWNESM